MRVQTPEDGIAWVTGASTGIGRATVLALVARGWRVAASSRGIEDLTTLAASAPGQIFTFPLDVIDTAAVSETIATIEAEHGPIALAFLNAGISVHSRAPHLDAAIMRRIVETNVIGVFNAVAPLVQRMAERRAGQIALCGSVAGYGGLPYAAAYCASKSAIINAAVSLAIECAPFGILIQCVNPGFVDTPLTRKNDFPMPFMLEPAEAGEKIADGLSGGRFEITFPRRLSVLLKIINTLPYSIYIRLVRFGIARNSKALPMAKE